MVGLGVTAHSGLDRGISKRELCSTDATLPPPWYLLEQLGDAE